MDIKSSLYTNKIQNFQGTQAVSTPVNTTATTHNAPSGGISSDAANAMKANATVSTPIGYKSLGIKKLPYVGEAHLYKLNNGQNIVIVPKKGPTVLKTFVKVGSMNEPDGIRGISHYIEHNLFNGSKNIKPQEFVQQVNDMGSNYNASTGFSTTSYFIKTPLHSENDLEKSIKLHSDMLLNPLFLDAQLNKERGPVISEISMVEDNPNNIAENTVLKKLFNIESKSTDIIAGSVENIKNVTRQDVMDYYNTWYTPDNMTTVIVGDVDVNNTMDIVSRNFNTNKTANNSKKYETLKPVTTSSRTDIKKANTNSTILSMGLAGPAANNIRESLAVEAINMALTGSQNARLTKALEKYDTDGFVYMQALSAKYEDPQANLLNVEFNPETSEEGLKSVYDVINSLKTNPITPEELKIIKNKMKLGMERSGESAMALCSSIGDTIVNTGNFDNYSNMPAMIDSLTQEDINNAVNKYFDLNKAAIVVVHPQNTDMETVKQSYNKIYGKNNISFSGHSQIAANNNSAKSVLPDYKQFDLGNNTRVTLNKIDSPMCSTAIAFTKDDMIQSKPGVTELLTFMMNEGNAVHSKEEFANLCDENGVDVMFEVSPDGIIASMDNDKEHQDLAMNMAKEGLLQPSLTQEKLDKAKNEIKMAYIASQKSATENAAEFLYQNSPYGNTFRKVVENLDKITLEDVQDFYGNLTRDIKSNVIVSSPDSYDENFKNSIFSAMSSLPQANKYSYVNKFNDTPLEKTTVIKQEDERKQAHIAQVFKIQESGQIKDQATLKVMNYILGGSSNSRLFNDLRESQKLAYTVKSNYTTDGKASNLTLDIKTTTDNPAEGEDTYKNLQKSLDGFKKHIDMLCNEPVSAKELENAKLNLKSALIFNSESSLGKNILLCEGLNSPYGPEYTKEMLKAIDNVSADDIKAAANKHLKQPSVISVVASKKTLDKNQEYLSHLG